MFFRKLFCSFFFEKTPPKMPQNNSCIKLFNARVAEIYQMLSNIWDLGDAVMYNPDIDNNTKCVFMCFSCMVPNETNIYKRRTWSNNFYN